MRTATYTITAICTILAFVLLLTLTSCGHVTSRDKTPEPYIAPKPPIEKKIEQAEIAQKKAIDDGDKIAQLKAERDELVLKKQQAETDAMNLAVDIKYKDKEISHERTANQQEKLYWFSGILGLLSLVGAGIAIWFFTNRVIRKYAMWFGIACSCVASLALLFAWLLPYLIYVGAVIVLVAVIAVTISWKRDNKALHQVVGAVAKIKESVPNFRSHFREEIDSGVDRHIDAVRERISQK